MQSSEKASRWRRYTSRRWVLGVALTVVALVTVAVPVAWATDTFADVPNSSPHHDDINTIARIGITGGCAPGLYCPGNAVSRDQMGSFIARTLRALTPVYRENGTGTGAVDLDAVPELCITAAFTPSVAARARVDVAFHAQPAASATMAFTAFPVFSTNGGASWSLVSGGGFARDSAHFDTEWASASTFATMTLSAGTTYQFATQVGRAAGTTDAADHRCTTLATITYNDAGASTIGAGTQGQQATTTKDGS